MADSNNQPLKIALHGFDVRSTKTMQLYLQGPCRGAAKIVEMAGSADVDVFDADILASKKLLDAHVKVDFIRPVIVLSLQEFNEGGALHVKKPVNADDLLKALNQAKKLLSGELPKVTGKKTMPATPPASTQPTLTPEKESDQFKIDLFKFDKDQAKTLSETPLGANESYDLGGLSEDELKELASYRQEGEKPPTKPVIADSTTLDSLDDWFNL